MFIRMLSWLCIAFIVPQAWAQSSVWKVSKGTEVVYLGGTIHLLKPSDYPLPAEFEQAYHNSDVLVLETDLQAAQTPAGQQLIVQRMQATPDEQVDQMLQPATYQRLVRTFDQYGLNLSHMRQFKVSMMMITLTLVELSRLGINQSGVDEFFYQRALSDGKPLGELESFATQIDFLAATGQGNEEAFVAMSLQELSQTETMMETMVTAWRVGDLDRMTTIFVGDMQKNYPDVYQQLLVTRNNNWLPHIEALFDQAGTEFVLVGVGHMPGEAGLIRQLQQRGYRVEAVSGS